MVYYDRRARIVYLPLTPNGDGETLTSSETGWGRIDYNRGGEACGVEIWKPLQMLPLDLLEALPDPPSLDPDG
jgi:uncharacterized protein YuzE